MAHNVFISFRYKDGIGYKEELAKLFDDSDDTVDFSEDVDRTGMSEQTIKNYLYGKLARSSVTIVVVTPDAISHKKDDDGNYDDWMYDEIRYSLEDRDSNRTNGLIAVYVPEVSDLLCKKDIHKCSSCCGYGVTSIAYVDNLFRRNMMNIKDSNKGEKWCPGVYDRDYDSYCSLIEYEDFKKDFVRYIDIAIWKKEHIER